MFDQAIRDSSSSVPGSASTDPPYAGSRKLKQRFEYSESSNAGFVELAPESIPTAEEFRTALMNVPEVQMVEWKESKRSQGNVGNHHFEHNLNVWVPGFARPLEFELTRDPHMVDMKGRPFTVSACFKEPPRALHADAWRILLHACKGRELLPAHVQSYAKRSLARAGSMPIEESEKPGSASCVAHCVEGIRLWCRR